MNTLEITVDYHIEDFIIDAKEAKKTASKPAIYGALVAAAAKRYKAARVLEVVLMQTKKNGWDMTPTLANNVIKKCWGRSISRPLLAERLNTEGRTAAYKSKDIKRLDEIVKICKPLILDKIENAETVLNMAKADLKSIKAEYDKPAH